MIRNHITTALESFRRAPFTTVANVLTLALGLVCFIAALGIATYWRSADGYRPDADRIVVVTQTANSPGEEARFSPASAAFLARFLKDDIPDLEHVSRAFSAPRTALAAGGREVLANAVFADPDFLKIFELEFIAGDAESALARPGGLILTQDTAARLFGEAPALGRAIRVDDAWEGVVTGVVAPVRQPSLLGSGPNAGLRFEILGSWTSSPGGAERDAEDSWLRTNAITFALAPPGMHIERLNRLLADMVEKRSPTMRPGGPQMLVEAAPIGEITTRKLDQALFSQSGVRLSAAGALLGLGLLILTVAGMNFGNLTAAQAEARSKQTGLRKALGATRLSLMVQTWIETALLTAVALAVALVLLALAQPLIRTTMGLDVLYFLTSGAKGAALLTGVLALVCLIAGGYPALVLSRVRPVEAVRSGRSLGAQSWMARILVGVQFTSASLLLIVVIVTEAQRSHLEVTAVGRGEGRVVMLNELTAHGVDEATLMARLEAIPGVQSVTMTDRAPWSPGRAVFRFGTSAAVSGPTHPAYLKVVRHGYFETLGLRVLAGRDFSKERDREPVPLLNDAQRVSEVVIDDAFARRLGFASPAAAVGQTIHVPPGLTDDRPAQPVRIIGVAETEASRMESSDVAGHVYALAPWRSGSRHYPFVRIRDGTVQETLSAIALTWRELSPNIPADIRYLDDLFKDGFRTYARVGQVFAFLAAASFLIASTGLIAIAVHVAARRRHEIAVRKTLGSTTWQAVRLLLADFSKPVIIANLIAWPAGYLAAETYLSAFAHRIELNLWPFALSLLITLAIAWLAVGGQTFKAATVRPSQVLRDA